MEGGGSTYFIAAALHEVGKGKLYTFETDPDNYAYAQSLYNGPLAELKPYIEFHLEDGANYAKYIPEPEIVLVDGAEDAEQTKAQLDMFLETLPKVIIFHDWKTNKTDLIREQMDTHTNYALRQYLDTDTGFRVYNRVS